MATKIYGVSDDLVVFEGDVRGKVDSYGTEDGEHGVLVMCSDGTLLEVKHRNDNKDIWGVRLIQRGTLFERIDLCTDEDAEPCSDVAHLRDGLRWAYAAKESWERVR